MSIGSNIKREPIEGFESTGETRYPKEGEWFASQSFPGYAVRVVNGYPNPIGPRDILRPKARGIEFNVPGFLLGMAMMEEDAPEITPQGADVLPTDSGARKDVPITTGVIDYFPAALAAVAVVSKVGNDKHNPGEPLHWARGKSTDQADAIGRHLLERGHVDPDTGLRHSAQLAWRALALLQIELEEAGEAPKARGAR